MLGQSIKTGSGTYTFTATGPTNAQPGELAVDHPHHDGRPETGPCAAVGASPPFTTTCTGTTKRGPVAKRSGHGDLLARGRRRGHQRRQPHGAHLARGHHVDNIVDIRDYALWRQAFGQTSCGNGADLNLDCMVNIRDYGTWRQWFGNTAPVAGSR